MSTPHVPGGEWGRGGGPALLLLRCLLASLTGCHLGSSGTAPPSPPRTPRLPRIPCLCPGLTPWAPGPCPSRWAPHWLRSHPGNLANTRSPLRDSASVAVPSPWEVGRAAELGSPAQAPLPGHPPLPRQPESSRGLTCPWPHGVSTWGGRALSPLEVVHPIPSTYQQRVGDPTPWELLCSPALAKTKANSFWLISVCF